MSNENQKTVCRNEEFQRTDNRHPRLDLPSVHQLAGFYGNPKIKTILTNGLWITLQPGRYMFVPFPLFETSLAEKRNSSSNRAEPNLRAGPRL